jgi:nitroimidazol reductase NimA-like FMN-containing flavoprotein (pyridoxamine 5'-phosphate oxidase superfamily)
MGEAGQALDVPPHVLDYLRQQKTLTLATSSPTGVPRATTLTYANDGPTLYIWTRPETTVARHVEQNPVVSFAIDEYAEDWSQTRGIQGSGEAHVLLNPADVERAVSLFGQKYEGLADSSASNISFFRIAPTELQYIDNSGSGGGKHKFGAEFHRELVYTVFRDLPEQQVATMASELQTVQVDPGTVIVRQGAPADKFFIIVEGEVEVIREDGGGERKLATLGRGQFFGEMAILRDTPRTATVRATAPTTLLSMERDSFRGLVAQSLGATQDFDRVIQERLRRTSTQA